MTFRHAHFSRSSVTLRLPPLLAQLLSWRAPRSSTDSVRRRRSAIILHKGDL